jgi:hypothetical protein
MLSVYTKQRRNAPPQVTEEIIIAILALFFIDRAGQRDRLRLFMLL